MIKSGIQRTLRMVKSGVTKTDIMVERKNSRTIQMIERGIWRTAKNIWNMIEIRGKRSCRRINSWSRRMVSGCKSRMMVVVEGVVVERGGADVARRMESEDAE